MHAYRLTGVNTVAHKPDSRKASIHAASTGLTGLTGSARAHASIFSGLIQPHHAINNSSVRMEKTLLTLLTLFKASIHAGFNVTGLVLDPVNPCKEA
ncbi:hypothetical protein [Massilia aerilata]|uniref:Uncharacterized protein n=1 Tax=Massilia aerilata TaxID=453817 RepID=A0ABW0RVW2_9BURK